MEFGLCFLLVFGLVYAIFEFGRVVYSYNVLAGATREASRYAMVHGAKVVRRRRRIRLARS